jgi:hypothetical protein
MTYGEKRHIVWAIPNRGKGTLEKDMYDAFLQELHRDIELEDAITYEEVAKALEQKQREIYNATVDNMDIQVVPLRDVPTYLEEKTYPGLRDYEDIQLDDAIQLEQGAFIENLRYQEAIRRSAVENARKRKLSTEAMYENVQRHRMHGTDVLERHGRVHKVPKYRLENVEQTQNRGMYWLPRLFTKKRR